MPPKFYAVKKGREAPAIYTTWEMCQAATHGFQKAQYKSFAGLAAARAYLGDIYEQIQVSNELANSGPKVSDNKPPTLIVYTDGSCSQPGTSRALAGAGIYFPQLELELALPVPGTQTNNRGELWAVIQAIEYASHLPYFSSDSRPVLELHLDSKYVMSNLESNNKENLDLWPYLLELLTKVNVDWIKEAAHTGVVGNERADSLAKRASMAGAKYQSLVSTAS